MDIKWADLSQDPNGRALVSLILAAPPSAVAETVRQIRNGKRYTADIKPYRESKSKDQLGAIWGKIGELADALYASKDEIYDMCLRRDGPSIAMRFPEEALYSIEAMFKLVDVKEKRKDGTVFVRAYKGLSQMDTAEASHLLDGVLSECKEAGLSTEVRR